MMHCGSELTESELRGSPCLVPRSRWKCLSVRLAARCWSLHFVSSCMYGSSMPCSLNAFHTLLSSTVSHAFLKSMAATHSGWCHSAALCLSFWNVNKRSVVERPRLKPAWSTDWLASNVGCRCLKRNCLKSLYKMVIEHMGRCSMVSRNLSQTDLHMASPSSRA